MARLLGGLVLLALCLAHTATACSIAQHTGIRLGGANLPNAQSPEASATACCDYCETRPDCKAWTYQVSGKTCWLTGAGYTPHGNEADDKDFISGWIA